MKSFVSMAVLAAAFTLGGTAVEQWSGSSAALAQSSACIQNCARVRDWPVAQCREFCRGRTKKKR
jgi:hypothetical protein